MCLNNKTGCLEASEVAGGRRAAVGDGRGVLAVVFFSWTMTILTLSHASADEGGVSFWVPGTFGSLAATPQQPGWSLASIYYYTSVSAGGGVSLSRELSIGQIPPNLTAERHRRY
jgi:hypothetical protein